MSRLVEQVEQESARRHLLRKGQALLVAVSGGCDSMVLLHVLHELAKKNSWKLTVAHFNHHLRGRSSDADERLVQRVAEQLKLPFACEGADVRKFARAEKLSLEMAARRLRHDFFARSALVRRIPTIALAQHADDQLELFFLRLLRGSGGDGLAGMKWKSPSPSASAVELIRPFLAQTKSELSKFARQNGIKFREDASNARIDFQRNRIRHGLLPLLRKYYQPALDKTVLRAMELIGGEAEFATQAARQWLEQRRGNLKGRSTFQELPVAVQRRCVQLQLLRQGVAADFELVEKLRAEAGGQVYVSGPGTEGGVNASPNAKPEISRVAVRDGDGSVHVKNVKAPEFDRDSTKVQVRRGGEVQFGKLNIAWKNVARPGTSGAKGTKAKRELFDADKIGSIVVLRHWLPGDRFQPIGMKQSVKLQDFFTNRKVPSERRRELVVATTGGGEVFWVEDQRISERFKLSGGTKRWLEWRWRKEGE